MFLIHALIRGLSYGIAAWQTCSSSLGVRSPSTAHDTEAPWPPKLTVPRCLQFCRQALMCGALWLACSLLLHYSFKHTSDTEQLTLITLQMVTPE